MSSVAASVGGSCALRCLALAVAYFAAARVSLELAIPPGYASPIWPSAGLAVGAMLVWGGALWPGVWLGAAAANFAVNQSGWLAAGIATGNTAEAVAAVWLARRLVNGEVDFRRPEQAVAFGVAAALSAIIAASLAVSTLSITESMTRAMAVSNWFTWWLGDTAGIVLVAPLMLAWTRPESGSSHATRLEIVGFGVLLSAAAGGLLLGGPEALARRPGAFVLLVFAVWAGCRFGLRAITTAAVVLVGLAVWATVLGRGPFALDNMNAALLYLQAFACSVALAGLALHALRRQRDDPSIALLRAREAQLAEAQRVAHIGSWRLNAADESMAWSDELFRILGFTPGQFAPSRASYLAAVHADDRPGVEHALRDALRAGTDFSHEYRVALSDGTTRHLHARGFAERDGSGAIIGLQGTCQDLTERRRAEARHRETAERFRMLVEQVRDYAIYMLDADGRVTSWNQGAARINGYAAGEILGEHVSRFYPPELGAREAMRQLEVASQEGRTETEGWRMRKDGTRYWAQVVITRLDDEDGRLRGYAKVTRDATERKQAEEDLRSYAARLVSTSRRLLSVQEEERRRLASDLHDRVGPNLTALGIKLELLEERMSQESRLSGASLIADAQEQLRETVAAIRNVMGELRPQDLADYGLVAALHGLGAKFSRRTGIGVDVRDLDDGLRLPAQVELALFRIAQETLNNVEKHSRATRVTIRFGRADGRAALEIRDNGIGIESALSGEKADGGWGLIIMRERAEAVGARFRLATGPGTGVAVHVEYSG